MIIYSETSYSQTLFDKSLEVIPNIQNGSTKGDFKVNMWSFYSNAGLGAVIALPIIIFYLLFHERVRCFYYVACFGAFTLLMNVTKLYYHQARPFWASPDVQAFGCEMQYGNPSGHSIMSMGIALLLWFDYNHTAQNQEGNLFNIYVRVFFLIIAVTFGLTIGYSRLFLGVHSMNQILFGWLLGTWMAFTCHFIFRDKII